MLFSSRARQNSAAGVDRSVHGMRRRKVLVAVVVVRKAFCTRRRKFRQVPVRKVTQRVERAQIAPDESKPWVRYLRALISSGLDSQSRRARWDIGSAA